VELRAADTDDTDVLVDLWVELARDQRAHGSHLVPEENRSAIREAITRRVLSQNVVLASEGGEAVGFVMYSVEQGRYEQDVTRGIIENVYVRAGRRRRGIGSDLIDAAERDLAERGVEVTTLEVMAPNEAAQRFYERHGYTPHRVELEKRLQSDTL